MGTPRKNFCEKVRISSGWMKFVTEILQKPISRYPVEPASFPPTPSIFHETHPAISIFKSTSALGTPVNVKHSGFKSLTAFLKTSAREGLIRIGETKGRVVNTVTRCLHVVGGGLIDEGFDVGRLLTSRAPAS